MCLENPRDCGASWAAVYGVAQSRTRLKRLSSSSGGGSSSRSKASISKGLLPPHTPPRLHSSPAVRGPAFPAASQPLGPLLPSTNGRGAQGQSEVSPISRVGKRQKVVRIRGAGPGKVLGILGDRRFGGGGATAPLLEHPALPGQGSSS